MAAKGRPGRIETDIEKYRGDGNWSKVLDLSKQLLTKTPNLGIIILPCFAYVLLNSPSFSDGRVPTSLLVSVTEPSN